VPRQFEAAARGQLFDEGAGDHMDRRAARDEAERAVRIPALGQFGGKVAVFDDFQPPLGDAEVAEFLERAGLGQHDRRHLGILERMQPEEERRDHRNQRVVHLEVGKVIDPFLRHAVERAGFAQRQERAAVAVGGKRERRFRRQQQLAVVGAGGHGALGEEEDLLRRQPEEIVFQEERLGRLAVEQAGHHIPCERLAVLEAGALDRLGEVGEERTAAHRADRIGALGAVEPEAGPLPSGDGEAAHLSGTEQFDAARRGFLIERGLSGVARHERKIGSGAEVVGNFGLRLVQHVIADQSGHFREIDRPDLSGEFFLFRRGKSVPEAQQLFLSGGGGHIQEFLIGVHVQKAPYE